MSNENPETNSLRPAPEHTTEELAAFFKAYDARKRAEDAVEQAEDDQKEQLTNRVSIAAIALTMLLSFVGFAREERSTASEAATLAAQRAKTDSEASWGYFATRRAERASYELADETLMRQSAALSDDSAQLREAEVHHADYASRIAAIDDANRLVFHSIQDLERSRISQTRKGVRIDRQVSRYDMGIQVLTLALVVFSVTLLANRGWLFWLGVLISGTGAALALNGYFLWV